MSFIQGIKKGYKSVMENETIKGAGSYLKKRSGEIAHEMTESPRQERMEHMGKRPRERRERDAGAFRDPYHTGAVEPQGSRGGMGMSMDSDMFGVGSYGREQDPQESPRRRKQKKKHRTSTPRKEVENSLMDPNYVAPSMRGFF